MMHKIRSIFRPTNGKSVPSSEPTISHINAPSSTFNNVGGHQYHINVYPSTTLPSADPSRDQAPFNDAPIDLLSIHFTGRRKELSLIAKALERQPEGDVPRRCALYGNQGVGKSQLTYAWANSTFARKENVYILWISATTVEKLYQGFCRLLHLVNHPDRSHPDQSVRLAAARRWLEEVNNGNWLLVLDNVFPDTLDFLRQHLPRNNGRGTILFTTRTEQVASALASTAGERHEMIEVPLLGVKDGVELFLGHFSAGSINAELPKIEAIVQAVGCLPLAISHAAAYMKQSGCSPDDMLQLYRSKHKIDLISWKHTLSEYEHKSVAATFTSQLDDLQQRSPDSCNFLRILAFFDPESIPLEMLTTGAEAIIESRIRPPTSGSLLTLIKSPMARQHAITQLHSRCLVTYHKCRSPTFRMHDLIQLIVLENTRRSSDLNSELFELAVELACSAFSEIEDWRMPEKWPKCELFVPHVQSLATRRDFSTSFAKKLLLQADDSVGQYLSSRGRYVEAEKLFSRLIADRERQFGVEDLDTLTAKLELAHVFRGQGRYNDAETLFKQVLQSRKNRLGPEHRQTLGTTFYLADVYVEQQRYDEAEALLKPTLHSLEKQFGSEDDDTRATMNELAIVYNLQRRCDEAESLLIRVLLLNETKLGSDHPATLATKHSLANVYRSQLRYDAAEALFQQILLSREKQMGSHHPETLSAMFALVCVYDSQGDFLKAENLLVRVLAGRKEMLGISHPDTQRAAKRLVSVYEKLGRFDEADSVAERFSLVT